MDIGKKLKINKCLMGIQNGDEKSLDSLYDLVAHSMRYIALKYLRNKQDAEDLEQDFWADIYNIADKFTYTKNGFSFLCKIMTNMAINRYHKFHNEIKQVIGYVDYNSYYKFDEDEVVNGIDYEIAVSKALETLDSIERTVIQLVVFEDKKIVQIAKDLNMSKSKVGRIKLKAEEKLKNELDGIMLGKK